MRGYIIKMLEEYRKKERISFSMPGHKGGKGIKKEIFSLDVTELDDTDSLHNPQGAIKEANKKIAKLSGASESFIMVNGSTGGIFTMLASVLKRGDRVMVGRACHMSVINACITLGLEPVFCEHKIYDKYSMTGEIDIEDLNEKLDNYSVSAVIITSPTYFGIVSDIEKISEILNKRGIPLLVDSAHGGHFMAGDFLPQSAIRLGADMVVESAHKTLNALNQAAVLHIKHGKLDAERVREMTAFFQTSSPSYPIAATAENAILEMCEEGKCWEKVYEYAMELKKEISENTNIEIPKKQDGFFDIDQTRLVFNFSHYDVTGEMVSKMLKDEYNIDVEMADTENIVLIATPSNEEGDFFALKKALYEISERFALNEGVKSGAIPKLLKTEFTPAEAFYADGEYVEILQSVGRISAKTVFIYPPAIPVIVPGSVITAEAIEYMKNSKGDIVGLKNGKIKVIKEG